MIWIRLFRRPITVCIKLQRFCIASCLLILTTRFIASNDQHFSHLIVALQALIAARVFKEVYRPAIWLRGEVLMSRYSVAFDGADQARIALLERIEESLSLDHFPVLPIEVASILNFALNSLLEWSDSFVGNHKLCRIFRRLVTSKWHLEIRRKLRLFPLLMDYVKPTVLFNKLDHYLCFLFFFFDARFNGNISFNLLLNLLSIVLGSEILHWSEIKIGLSLLNHPVS